MTKPTILKEIVDYTRCKVESDKSRVSVHELKRMINDAPPVVSFNDAFGRGQFGVIAEIKTKSPSAASMRAQNVQDAPRAYDEHPLVKAVSVLTNDKYFGMNIEELGRLRKKIAKPILRKDFMVDEYQIFEARAFGADAVLLMANVLTKTEMCRLWEVCKSLGMDALFESHNEEQIASLPADARVCGVNSRKLDSGKMLGVSPRFYFSRVFGTDFSPIRGRFELVSKLPKNSVKVAESGVHRENIAAVRDQGWDAALIGAALLKEPAGVDAALQDLQTALKATNRVPATSIKRSAPQGRAFGDGLEGAS